MSLCRVIHYLDYKNYLESLAFVSIDTYFMSTISNSINNYAHFKLHRFLEIIVPNMIST